MAKHGVRFLLVYEGFWSFFMRSICGAWSLMSSHVCLPSGSWYERRSTPMLGLFILILDGVLRMIFY